VIPSRFTYGPSGGHFLGGKILVLTIDLLAAG